MAEKWIKTPEVRVTVEHGKGKSIVRGPVRIAFTSANRAYISTEAHHNDNLPCLTFRDREWLASAHVERADNGTWALRDPSVTYGVSQRGAIGGSAPDSYRGAINAALLATIADTWTPELARAAEYASAMQELPRARKEAAEAIEAAKAAKKRVAALERRAAQSAPLVHASETAINAAIAASTA